MIDKEFIPYTQALALKELGFDEPCFTYYYEDTGKIRTGLSIHIHNGWTYSGTKRLETTLAPTFSQSFRWFRDKFKLYSCVNTFTEELNDNIPYFIYEIRNPEQFELSETYNTYEEAELACLIKLTQIVKDGNK